MTVGLFGGTFDPPHNGHVALVDAAERVFSFDRLLVLVVAAPGHRRVVASADVRLALTRLAFPDHTVELDEHERTIDLLRARELEDPVFLIGADELADFPNWKEPETVLELARLGVATRPGYAVAAAISPVDRVEPFEIDPHPVSSTEIRRKVAASEPIDGLVPDAVVREIERLGLYRNL